jgi:hypothetical protein
MERPEQIGRRRPSIWLVVFVTALLSAILTLGLDRGVRALRSQPVASPTPAQVAPVVVVIETPEPEILPTIAGLDDQAQLFRQLQQQGAQQLGYTFVQKAERQITFALEALTINDGARVDSELDAARTSLDQAFRLLPEDLKPQIDTERLEIGRIRADVEINPRGIDEDLRRMRDRLLSLISP